MKNGKLTKHRLGYTIGKGAAWVGQRRDGSFWQDGTDPDARLRGPYETNELAEKAAREALHITDDED